jgi:hypothetical protein
MNYYPNYYSPNIYGSGYNMQVPPQQQQMQMQPQTQQQSQMFQQPMLNGKIVDSADIVKVTEVPVGGYGVFPRADMGEVYIKTWGQDGTTQIITYKPVPAPQPQPAQTDINSQLLERLDALEIKLDSIIMGVSNPTTKKEEVKNESNNTINTTATTKF